ncbi:PH domain-containing protein [Sporosarcina sp. 6E9]|uniref:PH domain-containing protein n=1 Tax=Sporosarcina sp. 6E9 TaxID=2819235 RepID=UPI001B304081|nr:PH domain-containing protein [Sporosarcina sp. 6E9]
MEFKRYHPLTILFDIYGFVKNVAFFALILFVFNYGSESMLIRIGRWAFLFGAILTLVSLLMKWFSNRYAADEQAFHLKAGIFQKTERIVYYEKVQNVQRRTSFLHKIFRMTSISFQTGATGVDAKVEFKAVTQQEADRLELLVKEAGSKPIEVPDTDAHIVEVDKEEVQRVIHFTPTRIDVVKASFTSLSFLFLIVIVASAFSKISALFDVEEAVEGWVLSLLTSGWIIAGIATVLIILSFTIGYIRTFITYGKYEIASDDTRIYISKGVLDESAFSILKKRVQGIEISQSFMKRLLGLAEVKLISAGSLGSDEDEVSTLYPFLPVKRAYSMIEEMLPDYEVSTDIKQLPRKSLFVRIVKPYWFWLIVTAALTYFRNDLFEKPNLWWIISISFLAALVLARIVNYWNTSYAITDRFIQVSEGTLGKTTYLTRRDKIIEVSVKRTKLQQWTGLATIGLVNRAQPVRHESLPDVTVEEASRFYHWYVLRAEEVQLE